MIEVSMYIHHAGENAIFASIDGVKKKAVWIPLHLIEVEFIGRNAVNISLPEWFAFEHGIMNEKEPKK